MYIYGAPFRRDISEGGRTFAVRTVKAKGLEQFASITKDKEVFEIR